MNNVFANVSKWLTVPEAAELLGVPLGRVRRLIEDHHLFSVKRDGVQYLPSETIVGNEPLASLHGTLVVLLDAGFTACSHRLRCYVLIGFPKDTFAEAQKRLKEIQGLGLKNFKLLEEGGTDSTPR